MWAQEECPIPSGLLTAAAWEYIFAPLVLFAVSAGVIASVRRAIRTGDSSLVVSKLQALLHVAVLMACGASVAFVTELRWWVRTRGAVGFGEDSVELNWVLWAAYFPIAIGMGVLVFDVFALPSVHAACAFDPRREAEGCRRIGRWKFWYYLFFFMGVLILGPLATSTGDAQAGLHLASAAWAAIAVGECSCAAGQLSTLHTLVAVKAELNEHSATAQVLRDQIKLWKVVVPLQVGVAVFLVVVATPTVRVYSGLLFMVAIAPGALLVCSILLAIQYRALSPARQGTNKVHADAVAMRFRDSIASFAAKAGSELRADECGATAPDPELNGISLRLLQQMAAEFDIPDSRSAGDVCALHVKPLTQATQTPLVRLLQTGRDDVGALWCGRTTHFISYAWSYPFCLL
jgi:hypothetical protein